LLVVTGGAGFIGSHVAELALSRGERVIVVDDLSSGDPMNVPRGAQLVVADVTRPEQLSRVIELARGEEVAIAHLAAVAGVVEASRSPARALEVNVVGTANVLELARRLDAYFALASSAAVYGEPSELPLKESSPTRPISLYGVSKLAAEQVTFSLAAEHGIRASALRLFNVYGPRMKPGPYASVVYNFLTAALRCEAPVVYGDGSATRDFVFVADVAEAFLRAAERRATGVFNVGTGRETSVTELLDLVSRVTGVRLEPRRAPPRPGDIGRSVADVRLAREALGWSPSVSLEEGLRRTYEWLRTLTPSTRTC